MRELTDAMADLRSVFEDLFEDPVWNKRGHTRFTKRASLIT